MKSFLALVLAVAACSGPKSSTPVASPGNPGEPAASPGNPSDPVASPGDPTQAGGGGVTCDKEIAIRCRAPGVDGCDGGKTTHHVCVAQDAKPGPPCAQEIALTCPEGQIDACLRTPQVSANHLCVLK